MPRRPSSSFRLFLAPLLALTHGDGSLGSWQGSWAMDAQELAALVDGSSLAAEGVNGAVLSSGGLPGDVLGCTSGRMRQQAALLARDLLR